MVLTKRNQTKHDQGLHGERKLRYFQQQDTTTKNSFSLSYTTEISSTRSGAMLLDCISNKKGSVYHVLKVGARISPLETLFFYLIPILFLLSRFRNFFLWNSLCQIILFIVIVQIPTWVTQKMSYVDIGWPLGLMVLATNALVMGDDTLWQRRWLIGGSILAHGGRMFFGASYLFFPYTFPKGDLSRYQYAKHRFLEIDGMPSSWWPYKMQHDTLQQAYANMTVLACPIMLCAFASNSKSNYNISLHPLEIVGFLIWLCSWTLEGIADTQKIIFGRTAKLSANNAVANNNDKNGSNMPSPSTELANKPVLGYAPYDSSTNLWTFCRHPNYFFEWMAWNGIITMSLPSLWYLDEAWPIKVGFALIMVFASRFFYDCLMYWTGAEPAEHFSYQRRPLYRKYQETVRVFFPFELPFIDHGRVAGWPNGGNNQGSTPSTLSNENLIHSQPAETAICDG